MNGFDFNITVRVNQTGIIKELFDKTLELIDNFKDSDESIKSIEIIDWSLVK
jgi:hypothetical protein